MCGRLILTLYPQDIREMLPDVEVPEAWTRRYNIAPSQAIAVVPNREPKRVEFFRWGLIPSWATDASIGDTMINARGGASDEDAVLHPAEIRRPVCTRRPLGHLAPTGGPRRVVVHDHHDDGQ